MHGLKGKKSNRALSDHKRKTVPIRRMIEPDFADWLRSRSGKKPSEELINIARTIMLAEMGAKNEQ